jgi:tape measure domain-containing protein
MADFANLVIGVDTSGLKRGERDVKSFGKTSKATEGAIVSATKALALFGGAFAAARAVSSASQAYASMANSMRVLGFEADDVAAKINQIGEIAKRTRSPLEATAQLYQRVSLAARDLGASQQQVLRFTENVGLALAQQGGSSEQAAGALLQLSQALSGGTVRAEEFNSILEGALPIAQAAANAIEGAAGSVGQLRNMVIAGEVSSREFFNAILSSSEALEAAFGNTVPTVSQAITVLSTSFTLFVGQADSFLGASSALAEVIILLSGNIDILAGVVAAIAVAFGVRYVAAIVVARLATFSLTGALVGLKAALISTGIGALVVGAGVLAGMFSRLVSATGSFGGAMEALGVVAKAVLADIGSYFSALLGIASSVAFGFTSSFLDAFANTLDGAYDFVDKFIIGPVNALEDALGLDRTYNVARKLSDSNRALSKSYSDAGVAAAESARQFYDGATRTSGAIEQFKTTIQGATDETEALEASSSALADNLSGVGAGAKGAAAGVETLTPALTAAEDATQSYANTMQGFIVDGIGQAVDNMVNGFTGGLKSIKDIFVNTIKQMIAFAIKNKIMLSMGIGGSSVGTAASAATGGAGGLLGGLGASAGLFASSVGTGLSVVGSGFMAGGFGGAATAGMGAIGGGIGAGGAMGFGTALGAAIPFLGAAALAISLFSKKTKLLDEGLKLTVNGFDAAIQTFSKTKTSRFLGLSSRTSTNTSELSAAAASPITNAIDDIQNSVLAAAGELGIGARKFRKFSFDFTLSLKGLTEEQKLAAVSAELLKMGDSFASVIPGIKSFNQLLAVASERFNLQNRVLELKGKAEKLLARQREAELQATDRLNRKILRRIFRLEDAAIAEQKAADALAKISEKNKAIYNQRFALETQLLQLQGKTGALRQRELAALDPSNRALQSLIFSLEDSAKAAEMLSDRQAKAAELLAERQAKAADVARERFGLVNRVLELQGKDSLLLARIRADELRAANESNRSILQNIFALEDQAKASEKAADATQKAADAAKALFDNVDENRFATGVDFRRGLARASSGIEYSPQQSQAEMIAELKALNARIDVLQSTSEITANSSRQTAENTDFSNALTLDAAA